MTEFHKEDERFMRAAMREAAKGLGKTSPNPTVGAVITRNGKIIARAHHRKSGAPHAEIECLAQVPESLRARSTMYVTLEPCSTTGRTGACTKAIVESRIRTVVVGAIDPNPRHSGRGLTLLREAGVEVRDGVLAEECAALNEAFNKWIATRRPFVIAKCGMSLDGRLTRPAGESQWITNATARRHARKLRAIVDAILVGAETVRTDNPRLTVRGIRNATQPWRVVLTRSDNLPPSAHLFRDRFAARTLVYKRKSFAAILEDLGRRNVTSVMIEGGGELFGQALDARLIDKVQIYLGPILTGGIVIAFPGHGADASKNATSLDRVSFSRLGQTVHVTGYPKYGGPERLE